MTGVNDCILLAIGRVVLGYIVSPTLQRQRTCDERMKDIPQRTSRQNEFCERSILLEIDVKHENAEETMLLYPITIIMASLIPVFFI